MSWTFFAVMFTAIQPPVVVAVQAMISALSGYAAPILLAAIGAYIAGRLIMLAYSPSQEPIGVFLRVLMKCAIAYWIVASAATYNQYLGTLLLTTVPTEISHVISGASGNQALTGQVFDDIWGKAWTAGLAVYRNIPWSIKGIGLQFVIVLYWFVALISIAVGFLIFLAAQVILSLLVAVGILFAALFPFTATRGYFDRWLAACLSMVLLEIFVVTLLTLLTSAENRMIATIAGLNGGGFNSADEVAQLQALLGGVLLFFVTAIIAKQLPAVAVAVAGGVCADVSAFGATVSGAVGAAGSGVATGAGAAGRAVGAGANRSVNAIHAMTPTGPSLSGNP